MQKGLIPHRDLDRRVDHRPIDKDSLAALLLTKGFHFSEADGIGKIFFTNDKNLEILKGYKAYVTIREGIGDRFEIVVLMTDFSAKSAADLVAKIAEMNPEEVVSNRGV